MPYTVGPFDSQHIYVQWSGKLPGPEQWSCGMRLRKKTAGTIDSGAGLLVGISAAIATFHHSAGAQISAAAKLSSVKVNAVGTDGRYIAPATNEALYADLAGFGDAIPKYPNQIAWAVSLTTGFSRGPAHRGRFYNPLPDCYLSTDGRTSTAAAILLSGAVDTLVASINSVNADYEVAVFSRKSGAPGNRRVTGNLVGRTLDTQRRRRRSLAEDYQ